jgi:signal transduction histidine kinase
MIAGMMLCDVLTTHRAELIDRCRAKVARRSASNAGDVELQGISVFLEQLIKALRVQPTAAPMRSRTVPGQTGGDAMYSEIGATAARHGRELLHHGFTVDQVVHDYGDLRQAVTDLAFELAASIEVDEFRCLNGCLDNATAGAVTGFALERDLSIVDRDAAALNARLGIFAGELRNLIHTAMLALNAMRDGNVGPSGPTGAVLHRSLSGLRSLVDASLGDPRVAAGPRERRQLVRVADLIADIQASASLEAQSRNCALVVPAVDPRLLVNADRDTLIAAVGNLLRGAFKSTAPDAEVTLTAYAAAERILIDIADRGAEANTGTLSVRDMPDSGCVFTISLPRPSEDGNAGVT